jgi:hypothetical protein
MQGVEARCALVDYQLLGNFGVARSLALYLHWFTAEQARTTHETPETKSR